MTREEALTILNYCDEYFHIEAEHEAFCMARNALKERPQGKWIDHKDYSFSFCNVCGMGNNVTGGYKSNFCPNCGAKMRREGEAE